MGAIAEATKENFHDLVSQGVVLVDVWGPSCQPCFTLMPHVERLAEEREELTVVKLEAPKARRICIELRLLGLPAFILFKDGKEVARLASPDVTPKGLEAWLDRRLEEIERG